MSFLKIKMAEEIVCYVPCSAGTISLERTVTELSKFRYGNTEEVILSINHCCGTKDVLLTGRNAGTYEDGNVRLRLNQQDIQIIYLF